MAMARVTKKPLAALGAALVFAACGIASAQEVALATDSPDSRFLTEAIRGDMAEVKLGQLAQMRGQSEAVREFGKMLADDHSKAQKKASDLAKELNVTPPTQPTAEQMQEYAALARLSGAEFDRQFAANMVKGHQEEIAKFERQTKSSESKVAELAEGALPTLRRHLAMAQRLQSGGDLSDDAHGDASHDRPRN
jgi:putative membrane protein